MKKLERRLGLGSVIAISISAMLGSGIFVLPGIAAATTGPSIWIAYLLAGISVLPAAFSKSELATAMPTSGGTYVYIERTFGPMAGTIAGLGLWLSLLLKSAFALIGFGAYLFVFFPINDTKPVAMGILFFIVLLNILGVGKVSSFLMVIVAISIGSLVAVCGFSIFNIQPEFMDPLMPAGIEGLVVSTALVFVSYAGVTKIAAIAEEIKEPSKNIPRGILFSLGIVTALYCAVSFILVGTIPLEDLNYNLKPIYTLAEVSIGHYAALFIAVVAVLTMSSMSNSGLLAASRFPFAMSRDHLLPSRIGRLHRKFLTPVWSIIASGLVIGCALMFMDVGKIAKLASAFQILIYMFVNLSVIVLRETRVQWYKPTYKSPLYPLIQIFGMFISLGLLFAMGFLVIPAVLSISIPGAILYLFYSRKRTTRKGVIGIRGRRHDLVEEKSEIVPRSRMETMDLSVDANVVVILFGKERSPEMLIEMGVALAEHGNLEVAHITEVPEQTDLDDLLDEPAELRSLRRRVVAMAVEKKEPITFDPVVSHDISKTIYHISQRLHCQWLLIEWRGKTTGAFTFHNPMGWLKGHLRCNLGIFRDTGVRYIRKIMVNLKNDSNDAIVIDTADHLAEVNRADITLVRFLDHSNDESDVERAERELQEKAKVCHSRTSCLVIKGEKEVDTILAATVEYDLFIFGGSRHTFRGTLFGTDDDVFMAKSACSVISVQAYVDDDTEEDEISYYD